MKTIIDNGSYGIGYREFDEGPLKYFLDPYYTKIATELVNEYNTIILDEINKTERLEKIYGIGCFFKLKNDIRIYTIMNNNYGCAGTGMVEEYEYGNNSFDLPIASNLAECITINGFNSSTILQIFDKFSYSPAKGLITYYYHKDNHGYKSIYGSGFINNRIEYYPIKLIDIEKPIKKMGEIQFGNFIILYENGELAYFGYNDRNFMTSTKDRNVGYLILADDIDDMWLLDRMVVYKAKSGYYYAFGCTESEPEYILGLDIHKDTIYPFPGVRLTHAPFDEKESKIEKIVPFSHGVAVLHNNNCLYITGVDRPDDNPKNTCRLVCEDCDEILFGVENAVAYSRKKDDKIYMTDTLKYLNNYITRDNIYHPSIGLL